MPLPYRLAAALLGALTLASCDAVEDIVDPQPDLEIAIGASTLEIADGFEVVYTVIASNRGPAEATDVIVSIPVPDAIGNFGIFNTPPGTTCSGSDQCVDDRIIEWSLGTLAAGQSRALSVGIPVASGASGYSFAFSASVDSPTASSASASVTTRVDDTRPASISLAAPTGSVRPGETVTLDLSYLAQTPALSAATLRMAVPDGLTFVSATGGGALAGGEVAWNVGTVAANTAGRVQVTFQANADREPGHPVTAIARLSGGSTVTASSQAALVVAPASHLRVTLQGSPETVRDGFEATYSVQVANAGTTAATDVIVSIPVPDAIGNFGIFNTPPGTTCSGSDQCVDDRIIEWSLGTLAAGQSRALSVGIPVASGASGFLTGLSATADSRTVAAGVATRATPVLD